ncbi:uncharacterized protein N7479_004204 [Penicillium vulpinum]|uniref:Uncharacterized protein n=1 Tax=Penicillium vulpinum TaxID=29845 RepID=A0A1V6SCL7_9EURO|nr:uncharacterized protein N7479_004204 [Penicillium vulpinum]KAJ5964328.1 hypothetical protein N7479_004204 [Penicillium vulpinum]OQE11752.1 hypothetical protein PENVUL_c002G02204 [Penicillium vulpinum]
MTRTIHLVISSNGRKPAHFAIFVPIKDQGLTGKLIHVTGNPATGFFLEFQRNHDIKAIHEDAQEPYQVLPVAQIGGRYIIDTPYEGTTVVRDTTARDRLESAALSIPPPGRSPNPFDPSAPNCQNWARDYINGLVQAGFIASSAIAVIESAPKVI